MPKPANPSIPEFYVYTLEVRAVPFYVGIGRSSRASDRVRYVRYLMGRAAAGNAVKWVASNQVVAELLHLREQVTVVYLHKKLTRDQALLVESAEILRLLKAGHVLANQQQNHRPASVKEVVSFVLARGSINGAKAGGVEIDFPYQPPSDEPKLEPRRSIPRKFAGTKLKKRDTMPKSVETIKWMDLNKLLRSTEDEQPIRKLLDTERNGPNRPGWVLRIHQRLNNVRRLREQKELVKIPYKRKNERDDPAPRDLGLAVPSPRKLAQRSNENMPGSGILSRPLYDAVVVATNKMTTGDFFPLVQKNAAKPIVLRDLIRLLIQIYRPPFSEKDPDMVIRVRTRHALTRLGYLQRVRQ